EAVAEELPEAVFVTLEAHDDLIGLLTRRQVLVRTSTAALAALVASAVPLAGGARAADSLLDDATLQAFADTILPGRKATVTDLGNAIDPRAIAGVDALPGAVEADALALYHHPLTGFDALAPALQADLAARSLAQGGTFLTLGFDRRVAVLKGGLSFDNPTRIVWEAAAAVPFTAF